MRERPADLRTGRGTLQVRYDGVDHAVPVHLPARRPRQPLLVLDLHSSHGNAATEADCSRLDLLAEQYGFVVARPEGVIPAERPNPDRLWLWNVPGVPTTTGLLPGAGARDDIGFLSAVISAAQDRLGTADRVALAGLSGGARMASAYAAAHPERVVALAAVAGLRSAGLSGSDDRRPGDHDHLRRRSGDHPVPVIAFHGDADDTNPYLGGDQPRWRQSVPDAVAAWARHNGWTGDPEVTAVADRVTRISYGVGTRSATTSEVTLYRIAGGGHSWPGSDDPEAFAGLDASALIAEFFARRVEGVDDPDQGNTY